MICADSWTTKSAPKLAALTANAGILSDDCPLAPVVEAFLSFRIVSLCLGSNNHTKIILSPSDAAHNYASRPLNLQFGYRSTPFGFAFSKSCDP